jgi:hypothetical protein
MIWSVSMVESGLGVALIPRLAAQTEISRKQLVGLTVREMRLERQLHLIYRKGATLSHAAKAFIRVARGVNDKEAETADQIQPRGRGGIRRGTQTNSLGGLREKLCVLCG